MIILNKKPRSDIPTILKKHYQYTGTRLFPAVPPGFLGFFGSDRGASFDLGLAPLFAKGGVLQGKHGLTILRLVGAAITKIKKDGKILFTMK